MVQTAHTMTSGEKYLLVKGISGLGNRMECLLTALLYARLSERKLIVDWRDRYYSNDGTNVFERYFHCPVAHSPDEIPVTDSVVPAIWWGRLQETAVEQRSRHTRETPASQVRLLSIDPANLNYEEEVAVLWMYTQQIKALTRHFVGEFGGLAEKSDTAILRTLLREDLRLHPDIRRRVNDFKAAHFADRTVGVNVRYTDHRVALAAIVRALNTLLSREKDLSIFLCTDNLQIKCMFDELYPGTITTPHWYPERPGVTLHNNQTHDNLLEIGAEALVDLYLLAECDFLILDTSSSFARIAALLTTAPESSVLDVRRRDKLPAFVRRLSHEWMLKMGLYNWGLSVLTRVLRSTMRRRAANIQI